MRKILKASFLATLLLSPLALFPNTAYGQNLLPQPIKDILALLGPQGEGTSEFVSSRVSTILLLFLGIIILFAVVYIAFAALKYIQSRGDEGEVAEAKKGIEAIFQGIAILLISLVGIVLIFVFFGAELLSPSLYQVCVSAPNTQGCQACKEAGLPSDYEEKKFDTTNPYNGAGTGDTLCGHCEFIYFQVARTGTGSVTKAAYPKCVE